MSNGFFINVAAVRPALVAGQDNIIDVLVRVQAPDSPKEGLPERPRLNLAIVIDRITQAMGMAPRATRGPVGSGGIGWWTRARAIQPPRTEPGLDNVSEGEEDSGKGEQ